VLDLDLLHSFVSVVDAGGFTRARSRVHRTQSTISQQIKRLEDAIGRPLLNREAKSITLTEDGERLLSYARRILALACEANDVVRHENQGLIRIGVTEDFAASHLARLLADLTRARPKLRLDVHCAVSSALRQSLEHDDLDIVIVKRDIADGGAVDSWPERLVWVVSKQYRGDLRCNPIPLVVFGQACLYHNRSIHALESAGRTWRITYSSPNTPGVQAAVSAGLGIAILPDIAVLDGHRILARKDGFPPVTDTELALLMAPEASYRTRDVAGLITEFCTMSAARASDATKLTEQRGADPSYRRTRRSPPRQARVTRMRSVKAPSEGWLGSK
jgi:DNA-binding transcriptional LysR family regulator